MRTEYQGCYFPRIMHDNKYFSRITAMLIKTENYSIKDPRKLFNQQITLIY